MDKLLPLNTFTVMLSSIGTLANSVFSGKAPKRRVTTAATDELDAQDEAEGRRGIMFDSAFKLAKNFFEQASQHTVEELQRLGNTSTPAPPNVRVTPVIIPVSTRLAAGELLIETLGEDEVESVLGGREWWQRTAEKNGGVKGEWISMKRDWDGLDAEQKRTAKGKRAATMSVDAPAAYEPEMDEMRCMLFIHGGAHFFGSINSHRYAIWRLARKTSGRAFGLEYRLSPQYPFPAALSDALSAYLYLIRPPPEAKHRPIDPSKLTIAGDSAGGGLSLALLCLIRDAGLPMPAGGILISPWVDLTHSFPSILSNTETDVIPPYGFLFKPSNLWPPPASSFQRRADESTSLPHLKAAHEAEVERKKSRKGSGFRKADRKGKELAVEAGAQNSTDEALGDTKPKDTHPHEGDDPTGAKGSKSEAAAVLKVKMDGEDVEIADQIQLYATNEQLTYPFVSPLWMPSLGGLCPLYVLAGDEEVLRDEIIYMAHRASHPERYPLRQPLLDANPARAEKALTYGPTKVHLQIYDSCPHDLVLFSFTTPAKFAYRAIASFTKLVTTAESIPP